MSAPAPVAVCYLVRGRDDGWRLAADRFMNSYACQPAAAPHARYVICKGFDRRADLSHAMERFAAGGWTGVELPDDGLDLTAYFRMARQLREPQVCFLNSTAEILGPAWLAKLLNNLRLPGTGMVGCTGSYETLGTLDASIPPFPNVHLRSNAFAIDTHLFRRISDGVDIISKLDAYRFESGASSLTRQVLAAGLDVRVVGRNGRGYLPERWPVSATFRGLGQTNLLIGDNQTRAFNDMTWAERCDVVQRTWGSLAARSFGHSAVPSAQQ